MTFYKDVAQLPPIEDYAMQGRTYRYFAGKSVYGFGYGLSYTNFAYGPVSIKPRGGSTAKGIVVEAELTNTGKRAGAEVAQLYLRFPNAPGVPKLALRGFQRVSLAPGEKRRISFALGPRDLGSVSPEGQIRVLAGGYQAYVGGGQPGSGLGGNAGKFAVARTSKLAD